MMARRRVGSNQYRTKVTPDLPVAAPMNHGGRRRCGEVWGTRCEAWVEAPTYSHDRHGAYGDEIQAVRNPQCPAGALTVLSRSRKPKVLSLVAQHPNCPAKTLESMLDASWSGLSNGGVILEHPNLPVKLLRQALHHSRHNMPHVARNPNCPPDLLEKLATEGDSTVRIAVAEHPQCPPDVLVQLTRDFRQAEWVILKAASHPAAPSEALRQAARHYDEKVREAVAKHPNCPPDVAQKLMTDERQKVRVAARNNPNVPEEYRVLGQVM